LEHSYQLSLVSLSIVPGHLAERLHLWMLHALRSTASLFKEPTRFYPNN
jgi:hypothetical protein